MQWNTISQSFGKTNNIEIKSDRLLEWTIKKQKMFRIKKRGRDFVEEKILFKILKNHGINTWENKIFSIGLEWFI
jgi:hypothetical protein